MATLYKAACCEANDFQLFIGDNNEMCEERTIWVYIFNKNKIEKKFWKYLSLILMVNIYLSKKIMTGIVLLNISVGIEHITSIIGGMF